MKQQNLKDSLQKIMVLKYNAPYGNTELAS